MRRGWPPDRGRFQSTLPARGATCCAILMACFLSFQSTLPARGATTVQRGSHGTGADFNPRSPHGERHKASASKPCKPHFNPRSPHGERREGFAFPSEGTLISIHAPRTGSDASNRKVLARASISIHAPRTGSDASRQQSTPAASNFNPRSPHGERQVPRLYSRRSAGNFNPRSPHGERHPRSARPQRWSQHFNPRSPHGERQRKVTILSIRIIGFAQKVYHKTVLLRISLAENAVILPKRPRNPVRTSLQKAGGLRFARAIRAARPYSISSPSGA